MLSNHFYITILFYFTEVCYRHSCSENTLLEDSITCEQHQLHVQYMWSYMQQHHKSSHFFSAQETLILAVTVICLQNLHQCSEKIINMLISVPFDQT